MTSKEVWKPISGYEDRYEVSDQGRVRSIKRGIVLAVTPSKGYPCVLLYGRGRRKSVKVHHLVLHAFVGPPQKDQVARHLNDVPGDNRLINLAWGSRSENLKDAVRNGGHFQSSKSHCKRGHPLQSPNLTPHMQAHGWRACLACNRARGQMRDGWTEAALKENADRQYELIIETGGASRAPEDRTHCPRGHVLAEPNLVRYLAKRGIRYCLTCERRRTRESKRRQKVNA